MTGVLAAYLGSYGYAAVVLGTLLEGETIVLLAGFLAHQGYLHPLFVALAAFCGSLTSDTTIFLLSRYRGPALLRRFPRLAAGVADLSRRVSHRLVPLILCFRFLYGLRTVAPVFLALSGVPPRLFIPLNVVGAALWAACFTAAGYYFGAGLTALLGRLHHYEPYILAVLVVAGVGVWMWRRKKLGRKG